MRLKIWLIIITASITIISCNKSTDKTSHKTIDETSNSNIFPKENKKYHKRSKKELLEIWKYIDSNSNDREWSIMYRNTLNSICERGYPEKKSYCNCALSLLEKKVPAEFLLSHSVNTLAFMLGRASAQYCDLNTAHNNVYNPLATLLPPIGASVHACVLSPTQVHEHRYSR